ncbi:UxaA family hydrolase [Pseudodesulfovibrio thermohalotolerans]|uniref:UxaA family hydrolase n=1 Tax=Pseudodesulfovibrio thermohalotolerans TaxID=2880651 RepID=UPI0024416A6B|nr:UxaA family hydrolase [Pseudodesulfovibrio thermohalotolerans]WFS62609.1 UxaA family hydrolase [Pseudodesulfovibrio thermohalotolerans]
MSCVRIDPADNIVIATSPLKKGEVINVDGENITVRDDVASYHKVAARDIAKGEPVFRYGVSIGEATEDIQAGSHVHLHNMRSTYLPTYLRKGE